MCVCVCVCVYRPIYSTTRISYGVEDMHANGNDRGQKYSGNLDNNIEKSKICIDY